MKGTLLSKVSTDALEELLCALGCVIDEMKTAEPSIKERYGCEEYFNCISLNAGILTALRHQVTSKKEAHREVLLDVEISPRT